MAFLRVSTACETFRQKTQKAVGYVSLELRRETRREKFGSYKYRGGSWNYGSEPPGTAQMKKEDKDKALQNTKLSGTEKEKPMMGTEKNSQRGKRKSIPYPRH